MNATDILRYGHLTFLKSIENFPEDGWTRAGACGIWSVKDIIAHLASYELVLVDILTASFQGGETPYLNKFIELAGTFNDSEVESRRAMSASEVIAELNDVHEQVMSLMALIPPDMLIRNGTLPWYGMQYSLDDVFVYMYYGHKREHSAQIAAFRDRLN